GKNWVKEVKFFELIQIIFCVKEERTDCPAFLRSLSIKSQEWTGDFGPFSGFQSQRITTVQRPKDTVVLALGTKRVAAKNHGEQNGCGDPLGHDPPKYTLPASHYSAPRGVPRELRDDAGRDRRIKWNIR